MRLAPTALLAVAAAAFLAAPRLAGAQSLAQHVPADALAFAQWPGGAALGNAYSASNLKGLLDAFNIPARINDALQQKVNLADPDAKAKADLVRTWLHDLAQNPGALYVGPIDFSGDQPMPEIVLLSKVGADHAGDMAAAAKQEADKAEKKDHGPPVAVNAAGDFVVMTIGKDVHADQWLTSAPANPLSASAKYKTALAQAHPRGTAAGEVYVDLQAAVAAVTQAVAKSDNENIQKYGPALIDALGLAALRQAAWVGAFDGPDWDAAAFVGLEGDHAGFLLGLLDFPPLTPDDISMIPGDAAWTQVLRFDGNHFLTNLRGAVVAIAPQQAGAFDMAIREAYAFTGVDLQKDLFPSLGDAWVFYARPAADGSFHTVTFANRLRNPAKAEEALTGLETFANQMITQRGGAPGVTFNQVPLAAPNENTMAHLITTPAGAGAWTIKDGVLYIAAGKDALDQAVAKPGAFADSPALAALQQKIGQHSLAGFHYTDVPRIAPGAYQVVQDHYAQGLKKAAIQQPPLPPFDALKPFMAPGLAGWWSDDAGIHFAQTGPFPGWSLITPQIEIANRLQKKFNAPDAGPDTAPAPAPLP